MWDDLVGDSWVRYSAEIDAHSEPFGAAALDRLEPLEGLRVLDVGCGTSTTTCQLARRGAREVVGVDLSSRMLAAAVAQAGAGAGAAGLDHVRFARGDVLSLDLGAPFDALFSRFGVMFFDDAVAAFARLRSLLRSGGRLAVCTWQGPFDNPWMSVPVMATIPLLGPSQFPEPGEPGPFSLDCADRLDEVLGGAGWSDVDAQPVSVEAPHPAGDANAVAEMVLGNVPPLAEALRQKPEMADEMRAAIADGLRPYERDGRVVLGAAALVTTATA